jgi:large subunit ribosomal protein L13
MVPKVYTIDASGKVLGRLAVDVARILRGKDKPGYLPYKDENIVVEVKNIDKVKISGKKLEKKIYYHYTGYPGGLRKIPMKKVFGQNPGEVLKKAVWGMLPTNKLRNRQIRRLKIIS